MHRSHDAKRRGSKPIIVFAGFVHFRSGIMPVNLIRFLGVMLGDALLVSDRMFYVGVAQTELRFGRVGGR